MADTVVVVVEDDTTLLTLVQEVLEDDGYQVSAVDDPGRIQQLLAGSAPALFLIDNMLHTMSGIELARDLQASGYATTPIIGMSASPLMVRRAHESGVFTEVLPKPFNIDDLSQCAAHYIGPAAEESA